MKPVEISRETIAIVKNISESGEGNFCGPATHFDHKTNFFKNTQFQ
jgi:hypothetical protein